MASAQGTEDVTKPGDLGPRAPSGLYKQSVYVAHMKNFPAQNWRSVLHAMIGLGLVAGWHYAAYKYCQTASPNIFVLIALGAFWGLTAMRAFLVLHDCGHGSFFRGSELANVACGYLFSIFSGTPTDFGPTHHLHHNNVGNMDQDKYDWAETVFHTTEQFLAMPMWKRALWRIFRFPPVFFVVAPFGLWWVKFRIPFYTGKRRTGTYRPWNKIVNSIFVYGHHYLVYAYGGSLMFKLLFFGGWFGGALGMMLFHMQHVHNPGYQTHGNWNRVRAAMHGSSYLQVPAWLKVRVGLSVAVYCSWLRFHSHVISLNGLCRVFCLLGSSLSGACDTVLHVGNRVPSHPPPVHEGARLPSARVP